MSEVKVAKVEIKIGNRTVSLTLEQVQQLRDSLNELFGGDSDIHIHTHHNEMWWQRPWSTISWTDIESGISTTTAGLSAIHDASSDTLQLTVE